MPRRAASQAQRLALNFCIPIDYYSASSAPNAGKPVRMAVAKSALMKLLDGKTDFSFPAGKAITVAAQKITCRAGNVDITSATPLRGVASRPR